MTKKRNADDLLRAAQEAFDEAYRDTWRKITGVELAPNAIVGRWSDGEHIIQREYFVMEARDPIAAAREHGRNIAQGLAEKALAGDFPPSVRGQGLNFDFRLGRAVKPNTNEDDHSPSAMKPGA